MIGQPHTRFINSFILQCMLLNVLHLGYKFALYHLTLIVLNMTKVKQFEKLCKRLHDRVFYF